MIWGYNYFRKHPYVVICSSLSHTSNSNQKFPHNSQIPHISIGYVPLPNTTGINEGLLRGSPNPQKGCSPKNPANSTTWEGGKNTFLDLSPSTPRQLFKSSDLFQSWFRTKNEAITRRSRGAVAATFGRRRTQPRIHGTMVYLPTFYHRKQPNEGTYTIHGW